MDYGLIGAKLGHSYSPAIHARLGDYDYRLYERTEGEFIDLMASRQFKGLNVTIPYKVVEAEAEVPKAMATALREGKLGVMDYYNMQNIQSDTRMRESIAGEGATPAKEDKK